MLQIQNFIPPATCDQISLYFICRFFVDFLRWQAGQASGIASIVTHNSNEDTTPQLRILFVNQRFRTIKGWELILGFTATTQIVKICARKNRFGQTIRLADKLCSGTMFFFQCFFFWSHVHEVSRQSISFRQRTVSDSQATSISASEIWTNM